VKGVVQGLDLVTVASLGRVTERPMYLVELTQVVRAHAAGGTSGKLAGQQRLDREQVPDI
jgi:hypothetical protein